MVKRAYEKMGIKTTDVAILLNMPDGVANEIIFSGLRVHTRLVESMNLSINETWTTLKFTWPKPGKIYNNSYGTLPNLE